MSVKRMPMIQKMDFSKYTKLDLAEVFDDLETREQGLSEKEAVLRQKKYGLNEIRARNISAVNIFIRQFKSPFFYLLFAAVIISFLIGERIEILAVLAFVIINVAIGFFQEFRAENAVFLLNKLIPQKVKIARNGAEEFIEKKYLTPGDIVLLEAGDIVPADLRVIKAHNFLADESVLTGESAPILKHSEKLLKEEKDIFKAKNILFAWTSVASGKAKATVVATGKDTFLADIALKGLSDFMELLLFSVALIVSILPEALPAVVTFALAQGSLKMAKEHVVVKRLSAIEDLGNIEILCTEKTGTLTQNKLSLEKIVTSDKKKCLLYGILSSGENLKAKKVLNPFDSAIFKRAFDEIFRESKKFIIISERPFNSLRMKSPVLVESMSALSKTSPNKERILIVKGAPENILKNCVKFNGNFKPSELKEDTEKEGLDGKRVLAVAYKKLNTIKPR